MASRRRGQDPDVLLSSAGQVEPVPDARSENRESRKNRPPGLMPVGEREVVADHDVEHGQGEVVAVQERNEPAAPFETSGSSPFVMASTMARCPGMMTKKTLSAIMVPIMAPMWMYAARALKTSERP